MEVYIFCRLMTLFIARSVCVNTNRFKLRGLAYSLYILLLDKNNKLDKLSVDKTEFPNLALGRVILNKRSAASIFPRKPDKPNS